VAAIMPRARTSRARAPSSNRLRDTPSMLHEVFRHLAFPLGHGRFPHNLGAVVQRTVLNGQEPARIVIHDEDNDWLIDDGVNDPNVPGASVVACIAHVADQDPSVAELVTLPVGHIAERDERHLPWTISTHQWPDEQTPRL
jgi:hypothetical protein